MVKKEEKVINKEKDNEINTTMVNTKTLIMMNALLIVLVLISITISSITLYQVKGTSNVATEEKQEEENSEYDTSMFKSIDANKFVSLFEGKEKSLIYLGRSTCGYCVKFLPNLQKAQKEYGYKTYYLDITTVGESGVKKITKLDKFLEENYGYTPMIVVVKDGKILNKKVNDYEGIGYTEYKTFTKFLEKLDYSKK